MTGTTVTTSSSGTRISQQIATQELQTQQQPKLFTTLLFQALPYQEQLRLLISLRLETTLLTAVSLTFRAVSTRAGTSTQMAGEQAAQYSSTR